MASTGMQSTGENTAVKCGHYKRRCTFISPCCGKLYPCRLCHDEAESHELDRYTVQEIQCTECGERQGVSPKCSKCGTSFGKYFCSICRLYDDNPKKQFHCDACGLCRVGGKDNFFHCKRCDMCLGVALKDKHKCVEKVSRANCPVCMEVLHTSTAAMAVPRCNHMLHKDCQTQLLRNGNYTCPICNESFMNMKEHWRIIDAEIENTPMPEEYRDKKVHILCRDCHKESETLFHIFGQKCQVCGSYNTCGADGPSGDNLDYGSPAAASHVAHSGAANSAEAGRVDDAEEAEEMEEAEEAVADSTPDNNQS